MSQVQSDYRRLMEDMNCIWKEEVEGSEEARKVIRDLELHCKKKRNLLREFASAETWMKELEKKCHQMEEELKPSLLKFKDKLKENFLLEEKLIQECLCSEDWQDTTKILLHETQSLAQLERSLLTKLIKTVFLVRDNLLTEHPEDETNVNQVQQIARSILKQLDRGSWTELSSYEAGIVRQVVQEVEGIPRLVARIVDQLLEDVETRSKVKEIVSRGVQTVESGS